MLQDRHDPMQALVLTPENRASGIKATSLPNDKYLKADVYLMRFFHAAAEWSASDQHDDVAGLDRGSGFDL